MSKVEPEFEIDDDKRNVPQQSVYVDPAIPKPHPVPVVFTTQPLPVPRSDCNSVIYRMAPVEVVCLACGAQVRTQTSLKKGNAVWGAAFMMCLIGCIYGCCLIPCCIPQMHDTVHHCPNCKLQVGLHEVVKF